MLSDSVIDQDDVNVMMKFLFRPDARLYGLARLDQYEQVAFPRPFQSTMKW